MQDVPQRYVRAWHFVALRYDFFPRRRSHDAEYIVNAQHALNKGVARGELLDMRKSRQLSSYRRAVLEHCYPKRTCGNATGKEAQK
jgi:hypothetical protein